MTSTNRPVPPPNAILRVALNVPIMGSFDYLPPDDSVTAQRGQRVRVPFGRSTRVGIVVGVSPHSEVPNEKLRRAIELLDTRPMLDESIMSLAEWAASYYHHPIGEVLAAALPARLRRGESASRQETRWYARGSADIDKLADRAPVQARILELARRADDGVSADDLASVSNSWRGSVNALEKKRLLERREREVGSDDRSFDTTTESVTLNPEQAVAVAAVRAADAFGVFLLDGVTGSGKTEVYLECIEHELAAQRQTLVIVPEIGLTPQLVARFRARLAAPIALLHSGLSDTERAGAWKSAREGAAGVLIGTRSAIFTPLARPGLIIVDEEHDGSLKQQDGFRYSARDLAVWRARAHDRPVILGSATPSFESLINANDGRYQSVYLNERAGGGRQPAIRVIDLKTQPAHDGLTEPLRIAIGRHLEDGGQVMLYLNRRGYAPTLICTSCATSCDCSRCDARLVLHQTSGRLECHHCAAVRAVPTECSECGQPLAAVGQGTQRLESALADLFPDFQTIRIDRDTTRRRGQIDAQLDAVRRGDARIVVGTQMLTKGHDFPRVSLVGIVDADQGLFGTDFRSSERLAQSFVQVAGRAGRGERAGEVYLQTLFPEHPLLAKLLGDGYRGFAEQALAEREQAGWPPFARLALLRAEAVDRDDAFGFLERARELALAQRRPGVQVLGPAAATMPKRAGRYRGQLLLRAKRAADLQRLLPIWRAELDGLNTARRARWSLDVDPIELF